MVTMTELVVVMLDSELVVRVPSPEPEPKSSPDPEPKSDPDPDSESKSVVELEEVVV